MNKSIARTRKGFALLLAFIMTFSLMSLTAFAEEGIANDTEQSYETKMETDTSGYDYYTDYNYNCDLIPTTPEVDFNEDGELVVTHPDVEIGYEVEHFDYTVGINPMIIDIAPFSQVVTGIVFTTTTATGSTVPLGTTIRLGAYVVDQFGVDMPGESVTWELRTVDLANNYIPNVDTLIVSGNSAVLNISMGGPDRLVGAGVHSVTDPSVGHWAIFYHVDPNIPAVFVTQVGRLTAGTDSTANFQLSTINVPPGQYEVWLHLPNGVTVDGFNPWNLNPQWHYGDININSNGVGSLTLRGDTTTVPGHFHKQFTWDYQGPNERWAPFTLIIDPRPTPPAEVTPPTIDPTPLPGRTTTRRTATVRTARPGEAAAAATPQYSFSVQLNLDADTPGVATVTIPGRVTRTGALSFNVTNATVNQVLRAARDEARNNNTTVGDLIVEFNIDTEDDITSMNTRLDRASINNLSNANAGLRLSTDAFRMEFDQAAIQELSAAITSNVNLTARPFTRLSSAARAVIGTRPVFEFTARNTRGANIADLELGQITFSIPYELAAGESADNLYIVQIINNQLVEIEATFDNGWITWNGSLNGVFGVGHR